MKIHIKKFKKINDAEVTLAPLNVFIGTNNSGKSSFIQGIQFAISSSQTLELNKVNWVKNKTKTLALDSREFLYAPTSDISLLFHGKRLTGARIKEEKPWIEFHFQDKETASVKISRGKNGGFTTVLSGKIMGSMLSSVKNPYCVYVPGIAGIPIQEKYEPPISVKKSAARGDSNNYLRNILHTIHQDDSKWTSFKNSVNAIYENVSFSVTFDEHTSEYIYVYVNIDGLKLPLDSVGTGLLQIVQIFAYIEYFSPKIILLDEPDSHIHPTKQKLLSSELEKRTQTDKNLKIVFSTHSRYILESLEVRAKVVHFKNGETLEDVKGSNILLDIGAADADYLFSKKNLKYIIVTEDKVDNVNSKKEFLKKFLIANGLNEDEFVMHSYEGCKKVDFAKILEGFVQKQIPTAKVILHLDRDQKIDRDREIIKLKEDCKSRGIIFFLTKYQEVESYFCTPLHIHNTYEIPLEDAESAYNRFVSELEDETKDKIYNFILRERQDLSLNKEQKMDIKIARNLVTEWYSENKAELTLGKELLGKIKNFAQTELGKDPNKILNPSEALICEDFKDLLLPEEV